MIATHWSATPWPVLVCAYVSVLLGAVLPGHAAHALSVDLEATPLHVDARESTTLRWRSSGAKWCWSRGVWGGSRDRWGRFETGPLHRKTWYGITCSDGRKEVSDSVTVVVRDAAPELSVDLEAAPLHVDARQSTTLSWTSSGAKWCWSRGVWGGSRDLRGRYRTGPLHRKTWYGITCSDGKNEVSDSVTVVVREVEKAPALTFSASPATVSPGQSARLQWQARNVSGCHASGDWGGTRPWSGKQGTGALRQAATYRLSCSGPGGGVTRQVTVKVAKARGLSVALDASPTQVKKGKSATLSWSATGADSCRASGAWSGRRALNGKFVTPNLSRSTQYDLTCRKGSATAVASVTVKVNAAPVVRWKAPTRNQDGSVLTDLAGYKLYWGARSRRYTGSARINSPSWTQYSPSHLPSGQYFVAVTAVDRQGNESTYSNEITVLVP